MCSDQNADEPGTAFVDDPFQRALQLGAGLLRNVQQLVLQPVVHQLMQAFAKDVSVPQFAGVGLEICQQALDEFGCGDGDDQFGNYRPSAT